MSATPEPTRLPTLTEVVAAQQQAADAEAPAAAEAAGAAEPDEDQLTRQVLVDVERRIDLMLEYRLRDSLGPALARLSDALIREMRVELASTLRELVAEAVSQELANRRKRDG